VLDFSGVPPLIEVTEPVVIEVLEVVIFRSVHLFVGLVEEEV